MQELRGALELGLLKGELEVPAAIAQLEQKEKGKFRKLNAQVRDATGVIVAAATLEKQKKGKAGTTAATAGKEKTKKPAKAPPKDPLKVVRNAGKVAKSQPTKKAVLAKNDTVTINPVTINLTINTAPAPVPVPAQRKVVAAAKKKKAQPVAAVEKPPPKPRVKKVADPAQPKPRAEKKPKAGASDPGYFGLAMPQPEPGQAMPKQTGGRGGGAPKAQSKAAPVKKEPGAGPRTKQTARCSSRGGMGANAPRVKQEPATPVWAGKYEDGDTPMRNEHAGAALNYDDEPRYSDHYDSEDCNSWSGDVSY